MRRFHPGGIVEVDPRAVVASKPVERSFIHAGAQSFWVFLKFAG
jgi:hypothetical protein